MSCLAGGGGGGLGLHPEVYLGLRPANKSRRYKVNPSLSDRGANLELDLE